MVSRAPGRARPSTKRSVDHRHGEDRARAAKSSADGADTGEVCSREPGVRYPEREVNALLAVWHPDVAALRRYLVDEGLLTREAGVYWRSGGWVDV